MHPPGRAGPDSGNARSPWYNYTTIVRAKGGDTVMRARVAAMLATGLLAAGIASVAQAADEDPNAWHATFTPYVWATGLYGDVTAHGLSTELDASFLDVLENTDTLVGLAGRLEITKGRFGAFGDVFYVKTEVDGAGATQLDVTTRMWLVEFGALFRVFDNREERVPGFTFDVYVGGRYSSLELELEPANAPSRDQSKSWVDPIVGGRIGVHFTEHVFLLLSGDIGGFGVGSDFAWAVTG